MKNFLYIIAIWTEKLQSIYITYILGTYLAHFKSSHGVMVSTINFCPADQLNICLCSHFKSSHFFVPWSFGIKILFLKVPWGLEETIFSWFCVYERQIEFKISKLSSNWIIGSVKLLHWKGSLGYFITEYYRVKDFLSWKIGQFYY